MLFLYKRKSKTERAISNGLFRDTGNIGHMTQKKTNKTITTNTEINDEQHGPHQNKPGLINLLMKDVHFLFPIKHPSSPVINMIGGGCQLLKYIVI